MEFSLPKDIKFSCETLAKENGYTFLKQTRVEWEK
jgi:hypothetical protein